MQTDRPIVLLAEDDPGIRGVVREILDAEGFRVREAENGATALLVVEELRRQHVSERPAVILLDMRMPVMDGWAFVREYRQRPGPHAPIVAMTAARDANAWASEIRADGVLPKPFELGQLLSTVERLARVAVPDAQLTNLLKRTG